jgi:hypothetical protein
MPIKSFITLAPAELASSVVRTRRGGSPTAAKCLKNFSLTPKLTVIASPYAREKEKVLSH